MDKELLARKLYVERVEALLGDQPMDEHILEEMWENRASPSEAAKAMTIAPATGYDAPPWLARYLNRK
ncbi:MULTISPECIES: hypothetical protein [Vibrio]|uniref:Uncharacterized protein n=1 Tax=Vibrio metoecus TaxID=1481663 RepID=A0A067B8S2_VIBMT|nr:MULTISPECIES: hypothetical protein [Vibrio]EEX67655.1 hypothetical protein VCJ_000080 [Vibrio metoecus]KDO14744.1 hypothetical protein DP83_08210 [Vibrio metoecus]KQA22327.1 hypothetical protein AAY54_01075 [Vibrio metoecus]KQA23610.1 hypothetical protein AAY55_08985 [Vibrio metoecus]KQA27622.1 hypothetical protein AAY53_04315 [Vibrio metoecus]